MKKILVATLIGASLLMACAAVPGERGRHSREVMHASMLPTIVVLGAEPYYFQDGYQ